MKLRHRAVELALGRGRILAQVAGPNMPVIKLLPSLVIGEADLAWIEDAFADVIGEAHKLGAMWGLGRMLVAQGHEGEGRISLSR